MKKWILFLCLYFCLCLAAGCTTPAADDTPPLPDMEEEVMGDHNGPPASQPCRIVDGGEDGNLLLAGMPGGIYSDGGVYRLSLTEEIPVYIDGKAAAAADLEDGMPLEVIYDGGVMETFPAQFGGVRYVQAWSRGTEQNPGGTYYDLCGFYLQVLDDLWQVDPALNENKPLAGLDLSQAPGGLTESEKQALAWRFGELHGVEVITGTFAELLEQGYITAEPLGTEDAPTDAVFYHWEDGCLFSITPHETEVPETYSLPVLRFDAEKYASSLGAYFFYDCSAVWPQMGTWTDYNIGSEMIS